MVERTLPKPDTRVRFPSAAPQAPDFTVWGFIFWVGCGGWAKGLGCGLGWTGRGGMFLAPAGNPSSLRFGHPDVATEHTDLSPTILSPLREVE